MRSPRSQNTPVAPPFAHSPTGPALRCSRFVEIDGKVALTGPSAAPKTATAKPPVILVLVGEAPGISAARLSRRRILQSAPA